MDNFPDLKESAFVKARGQFHFIAKIIGKVRETLVKPIAKNDNLWLSVTPGGFSLPPIEHHSEFELGCSPKDMLMELGNNKSRYESIDLKGKTFSDIIGELNELLKAFGFDEEIVLGDTPAGSGFNVSEQDALDFHTQLINYGSLIKEFHATINTGVRSQICLWPHHFDNAFKWFSGKRIDEQDEQMGIGVSNGDETYALPYIYITFWPPLRKTNTLEIIDGAVLHDEEWTGLILPYEAVAERSNIENQKALIEDFYKVSFASVSRAFSKR